MPRNQIEEPLDSVYNSCLAQSPLPGSKGLGAMHSTSTSPRSHRDRIPQVELLRAIAVGAVFLFHFWSLMPEMGQTGRVSAALAKASSFGHLGVVVFNILTGFVLSVPHLGHRRIPAPSYKEFLKRRFLRIVPHYWIALTFWSLFLIPSSSSLSTLAGSFLSHLFFLHTFSTTAFFSIVPAYWWLGLLAQFYLAFPLLVRLSQRWGPLRCLILTTLTCWMGWLMLHWVASYNPGGFLAQVDYLLYFHLPARLPEFAIGMWLASIWPQAGGVRTGSPGKHTWASFLANTPVPLCAILALLGAIVPEGELPLYHPYLVGWCLSLVLAGLLWKSSRLLGTQPLILSLGQASYSIYLLHQPVLGYTAKWLGSAAHHEQLWPVLVVVASLATLILAFGLDTLVAKGGRCRNQSRPLGDQPLQ